MREAENFSAKSFVESQSAEKWPNLVDKITSGVTDNELIKLGVKFIPGSFFASKF